MTSEAEDVNLAPEFVAVHSDTVVEETVAIDREAQCNPKDAATDVSAQPPSNAGEAAQLQLQPEQKVDQTQPSGNGSSQPMAVETDTQHGNTQRDGLENVAVHKAAVALPGSRKEQGDEHQDPVQSQQDASGILSQPALDTQEDDRYLELLVNDEPGPLTVEDPSDMPDTSEAEPEKLVSSADQDNVSARIDDARPADKSSKHQATAAGRGTSQRASDGHERRGKDGDKDRAQLNSTRDVAARDGKDKDDRSTRRASESGRVTRSSSKDGNRGSDRASDKGRSREREQDRSRRLDDRDRSRGVHGDHGRDRSPHQPSSFRASDSRSQRPRSPVDRSRASRPLPASRPSLLRDLRPRSPPPLRPHDRDARLPARGPSDYRGPPHRDDLYPGARGFDLYDRARPAPYPDAAASRYDDRFGSSRDLGPPPHLRGSSRASLMPPPRDPLYDRRSMEMPSRYDRDPQRRLSPPPGIGRPRSSPPLAPPPYSGMGRRPPSPSAHSPPSKRSRMDAHLQLGRSSGRSPARRSPPPPPPPPHSSRYDPASRYDSSAGRPGMYGSAPPEIDRSPGRHQPYDRSSGGYGRTDPPGYGRDSSRGSLAAPYPGPSRGTPGGYGDSGRDPSDRARYEERGYSDRGGYKSGDRGAPGYSAGARGSAGYASADRAGGYSSSGQLDRGAGAGWSGNGLGASTSSDAWQRGGQRGPPAADVHRGPASVPPALPNPRYADEDEKTWYYIDPQNQTQGPCSIKQFRNWLGQLKSNPDLAREYEQFMRVDVWKDGMANRIPLMALVRDRMVPP